jgi:hypothetical protein
MYCGDIEQFRYDRMKIHAHSNGDGFEEDE